MNDYRDLASIGLRGLIDWYLDPPAGFNALTEEERYGLLQVLTGHLEREASQIGEADWPRISQALDVALRIAPIDRFEATSRHLYAMGAVLDSVAARRDVPLLDPDHGARLFLDTVPMSRKEAATRAAVWPTLPVAEIRPLRKIKNMLTPLMIFRHQISDQSLSRRVAEWAELRDQLP